MRPMSSKEQMIPQLEIPPMSRMEFKIMCELPVGSMSVSHIEDRQPSQHGTYRAEKAPVIPFKKKFP
ncbi:MAG: hypothetical protein H6868_09525 [Rhodospirillales bacterium]|nr:hypothetical protein [Rhodospirillales bacterium]